MYLCGVNHSVTDCQVLEVVESSMLFSSIQVISFKFDDHDGRLSKFHWYNHAFQMPDYL